MVFHWKMSAFFKVEVFHGNMLISAEFSPCVGSSHVTCIHAREHVLWSKPSPIMKSSLQFRTGKDQMALYILSILCLFLTINSEKSLLSYSGTSFCKMRFLFSFQSSEIEIVWQECSTAQMMLGKDNSGSAQISQRVVH